MVFVILEASLALRAVLGLKRKVGETRVIYMIGLPGTFVTFAVVLPAVCVFGLWTGLVLSISFGSASSAKRTRWHLVKESWPDFEGSSCAVVMVGTQSWSHYQLLIVDHF